MAWDHPRLPSLVLTGAKLRLNSHAVPAVLLPGGTARASRRNAVRQWLESACGDYAASRVRFIAAYLDFAEAELEGGAAELAALVARFGGLYAREDWTWSALRPLPRAWVDGPAGPAMADIAFWDGAQVTAIQLGSSDAPRLRENGATVLTLDGALADILPGSFRRTWRDDPLPSSPFRRPIAA